MNTRFIPQLHITVTSQRKEMNFALKQRNLRSLKREKIKDEWNLSNALFSELKRELRREFQICSILK